MFKLRSLILKLGFRCSHTYKLTNRGQTLHIDSARFPPISHQCVIRLCSSYDTGQARMKMQITEFPSETKSIGQVRNAILCHIKRSQ